jgi:signal transduction histidine kinase
MLWIAIPIIATSLLLLVTGVVVALYRRDLSLQALDMLILAALGTCGIAAGLLAGFTIAQRISRSIVQLSEPLHDAAGKLKQVMHPIKVPSQSSFSQLEVALGGMADQIGTVVKQLQEREREVLRHEQMAQVGQLAAGVAHELRNPLTSIKMLVQTNREEAEANGLPNEDLHIIEQEILRLERYLQRFLDFARPPRPERRPLLLGDVIERTLALVGGRARHQGVTMKYEYAGPPLPVEADSEQIQQLLVNLTLNTLDAMPRGGLLEVIVHPPENGRVELHVLDTGPGIPAELLPRLFEPFVSTKETGVGLGLVISRRIAESHGGTLSGMNRPGGGACFILRLPVLELPEDKGQGTEDRGQRTEDRGQRTIAPAVGAGPRTQPDFNIADS